MNEKVLWAVVAAAGLAALGTMAFWSLRARPAAPGPPIMAPNPGGVFIGDLGGLVDPSRLVVVVWVNDSGKPCKATFVGGSGNSHISMSADLPEGEGRPSSSVSGPFTLDSVTIERDGQKKSPEPTFTVPPNTTAVLIPQDGKNKGTLLGGTTYEIHIGRDDAVTIMPVSK
jgi:hypothetical protein